MSPIELVALILALVGPLLALAKLLGVPETLALFGVGLAPRPTRRDRPGSRGIARMPSAAPRSDGPAS